MLTEFLFSNMGTKVALQEEIQVSQLKSWKWGLILVNSYCFFPFTFDSSET